MSSRTKSGFMPPSVRSGPMIECAGIRVTQPEQGANPARILALDDLSFRQQAYRCPWHLLGSGRGRTS